MAVRAFRSALLRPLEAKGCIEEGPRQLCFHTKIALFSDANVWLGVCASIRLCVSVRLSVPAKSSVTFDALDGSGRNFQGPLNSFQVIFGPVIWTPGPYGSGPDPEKGGFMPNLSALGVLGQGVLLGEDFLFLADSLRKRGRKAGLAAGANL